MLGFHAISAAPISALKKVAVVATEVAETLTGGYVRRKRKKRWSVRTGLGEEYFDSAEAAWAFYNEPFKTQPKKKKKLKKVTHLGKAISFEGKDLKEIKVANTTAFNVLASTRRTKIIDRLIERALQKEEEEFLLLVVCQ